MSRKRIVLGTLLAVVLGAGAIITVWLWPDFRATAPQGFADYDDWFGFRAVSPEGVVYRVRAEDNDPKAELSFWREALKKRMLDAGYTFISDGDIKANGRAGYLLELAAPQGPMDYSYLVALFVDGDKLVVAEVAGEVTKVRGRRQELVSAISAIRL
jgi:hypothetical protein